MHKLITGMDSPMVTEKERKRRIKELKETVEHYLPEIDAHLEKSKFKGAGAMVFMQEAFGAKYDYDEYTLLGMVIKYIGLKGMDIQIFADEEQKKKNQKDMN